MFILMFGFMHHLTRQVVTRFSEVKCRVQALHIPCNFRDGSHIVVHDRKSNYILWDMLN